MESSDLFIPCGCADGSLRGDTQDCIYCKSTGKHLTTLGRTLMELVEYAETQKQFDLRLAKETEADDWAKSKGIY